MNRPDALSERDKREVLTAVLARGGLDEVADITHSTRRVTPDEAWGRHAVEAYRLAIKDPASQLLQRHDASVIKGLLNQLTDDSLIREFRKVQPFQDDPATTLRGVFAKLMWSIISERGLQSKAHW